MRIAAFVFGSLASILCLVAAMISFGLSAIPGDAAQNARILTMGYVTIAAAIVGFLGAGLALGRPRLAVALLLMTAVVATIYVGPLWLVVGPLFLIAALLAFLSREKRPRRRPGGRALEHDLAVR